MKHAYCKGIVSFCFLLVFSQCVPPPNVQTRPLELLALVELQINNTPTQSDDYLLGTASTPARIRLLNPSTPPADVPVTLKNLDFQTHPNLLFATSGTPNASTLDVTLPGDGTWVSFVVAGASGQLSTRDKDAVIEILETRPDGIVLGRKSLMVATSSPVSSSNPSIELRLGGAETIDDYVAWRPVGMSVHLTSPSAADVPVTVQNMSPAPGGTLVFGASPVVTSTSILPPVMSNTVALTLPAGGGWVSFSVAGSFGHPSRNDKDAVVEVVRTSDGAVLGREGVMVRIRENANTLTTDERDRYLNAVARLNLGLGNYSVYDAIHVDAATSLSGQGGMAQGHTGPAFLAWHRAFILRYERELQAIDPAVLLHYWKFDAAAPQVFSASFMGGPPNSSGNASFDPANPLTGWTIEGLSGIVRCPAFAPNQSPTGWSVLSETGTLAIGSTYATFRTMENNPHGQAHITVGRQWCSGWVGWVGIAVRDPLFFMLHSNVERLWAKWQDTPSRQDPTSTDGYDPQGSYPGSSSLFLLGQYLDDQMWPWDGRTGFVVAGDAHTQRPATAAGGPIPGSIGGLGPGAKPTPRDVIDYDRWTLFTSGLGYGYDDVPFIF